MYLWPTPTESQAVVINFDSEWVERWECVSAPICIYVCGRVYFLRVKGFEVELLWLPSEHMYCVKWLKGSILMGNLVCVLCV